MASAAAQVGTAILSNPETINAASKGVSTVYQDRSELAKESVTATNSALDEAPKIIAKGILLPFTTAKAVASQVFEGGASYIGGCTEYIQKNKELIAMRVVLIVFLIFVV